MMSTLVFDVNETMLDLRALDSHFERIFGDSAVRGDWFSLVLRNAMALTVIDRYRDFAAVAASSLQMIGARRQTTLTDADRADIAKAMTNLPAHDDVATSLRRLRHAGLRLTALTNSPPAVATEQLTNAGLINFFERAMSVHAAGRLKPHPAVYRYAATEIGVPLDKMMMVAAHDWDIAGAMATGMEGAYVIRPGMARNPLFPEPTVSGPTMHAVTDAILSRVG